VAASHTARRLVAEDSLLSSAQESLQTRFAVGGAPYVDVLRLRTERLRVQTDRAKAVAEARAERESLSGLAGTTGTAEIDALVDSVLAMPDPVGAADAIPAPPSLDSLLALSGSIQVAEAAMERATARRARALADQRPRLSAAIGAQRRVEGGQSSFGPVLSGSITLPFTAGRANRAGAEASEREVDASRADLKATEAAVRAELAAALARYEAARERVATFDATLLEGARQEREAALAAYGSGSLSLIELLDFERALARAEIERLRARADAVEAYANLISATGGTR
jgi:cobalt-zinc-cadmium efflux system outer membrane protein